ncbi:L-serine dehydratase, alpha chain [Anatilimnocola aggregata]|uniref:L-serine ammonia-lyase n=1 Tax=Anatilimnocola aggregata TaxID=2528021 RepID=A0A517YL76_9BACT|nr:L-serine ammonia-lyase, iron-sulfur-dependent, subunit alpha [Anatilimnocola aggregata]QDU30985.1 L-serine dehydratase, alpha chain [Anatilimnocola aggregata]
MNKTSLPVSIFNDVIGPVMRGPSSSHCAAALRIGRLARDLMGQQYEEVLVEFDRTGSLPTTHESQGSDMGLFGGLMGWEADDERLPDSGQHLSAAGVQVRIETVDVGDEHPNTYRLTLRNGEKTHFLRAISTGGGMIEVLDIDEFAVSMFGDYHVTLLWLKQDGARCREQIVAAKCAAVDVVHLHESSGGQLLEVRGTRFLPAALLGELQQAFAIQEVQQLAPVLPIPSFAGMRVPFNSCAELLRVDAGRGLSLTQHAIDFEMQRSGLSEEAVVEKMIGIVRILRKSIQQGIAGTTYDDRVLPPQSPEFQKQLQAGNLLDGGALNKIVLYVSALMEVKSSMGVIVAAPTAGACAALPAAIIAIAESQGKTEREMAEALLASGLIGVFIAAHWTFAAEVGGCQAEGGSAAAMAAAALVTLGGGTLPQAVAAASMAMQSMIGLICDPVANRVEVPCLGKNVMAATNALACANMAIANFDPVIPFDEVVATAKRVALQMPRELRCTNLGGLSITPTSIALEAQLATRKSAGCGSGCGCGIAPMASLVSLNK